MPDLLDKPKQTVPPPYGDTRQPIAPQTPQFQGPGAEADRCRLCGDQIAAMRGKVMVQLKAGGQLEEEKSRRAQRQSYFGCGGCGLPVPLDHPRQVELDRQWDELEAKEKKERERVAKVKPAKMTPHKELNLVQALAEDLATLQKRVSVLENKLADQQKHITALEAERVPKP